MEIYNTKKNPVITKNFDCSTAHITAEDNRRLLEAIGDPQAPVIVYKYAEGYFIYVPTETDAFIGGTEKETIKAYGFSDAFINLLKVAADLGCKYLQLDSDAMEYEDLPTFEW